MQKQKIRKRDIYQWISQFPNPLFLRRLILNRKEEVLSLKLRDFILKIKGRLTNYALNIEKISHEVRAFRLC